jgi:DNA-binding MltR family transcriptional regulator
MAKRQNKSLLTAFEERFVPFQRTLEGESDRGFMLVACNAFDEALAEGIENSLLKSAPEARKQIDTLLYGGPMPVLGSFYARTQVAFALGIIDLRFFNVINLLREIRNIAGHATQDFRLVDHESKLAAVNTFLSAKEKRLMGSFDLLYDSLLNNKENRDSERARGKFTMAVYAIFYRLSRFILIGKAAKLGDSSEERGILDSVYDNLHDSIESISKHRSSLKLRADAAK